MSEEISKIIASKMITAIASGVNPQHTAMAYELTELVYKTEDEIPENRIINAKYDGILNIIKDFGDKEQLKNCMTLLHYAKLMDAKGWHRKANDAFKTAREMFDEIVKQSNF